MFKIGEAVIYGSHGVCQIEGIETVQMENLKQKKYYVLNSLHSNGLILRIPTDNEKLTSRMKEILSVDEIRELVSTMSDQEELSWIDSDAERERSYFELVKNGTRKELVSLIKTLHLKEEERMSIGRKLRASDDKIFRQAKEKLHSELAYVLNISIEEVVPLVMQNIEMIQS